MAAPTSVLELIATPVPLAVPLTTASALILMAPPVDVTLTLLTDTVFVGVIQFRAIAAETPTPLDESPELLLDSLLALVVWSLAFGVVPVSFFVFGFCFSWSFVWLSVLLPPSESFFSPLALASDLASLDTSLDEPTVIAPRAVMLRFRVADVVGPTMSMATAAPTATLSPPASAFESRLESSSSFAWMVAVPPRFIAAPAQAEAR